jgi:hypothetical protein
MSPDIRLVDGPADVDAIVSGLEEILARIEAGDFDFSVSLEDIHMNIEARLSAAIGEAGKRLHTGRSRNDQVAVDIRLYLREEIGEVLRYLDLLKDALLFQAETNLGAIMPGYTHLQVAQLILFSPCWPMEMFSDKELSDAQSAQRSPLGAGASGTNFPSTVNMLRANHLGPPELLDLFQTDFARVHLGIFDSDASVPFLRRTHPLVDERIRFYRALRLLLHRLVHHAAEEKSGRSGTGAGQDRPGLR